MFVAGTWNPWSWTDVGVPYQLPVYEEKALQETVDILSKKTPLVFAGECRMLERHLGEAACGKGFALMGGDCAETFDGFSADRVRDDFLLLMRMSLVMSYSAGMPVTPIGRMAGQFAKPRSALWEESGIRAYQGDMINGLDPGDRTPDPRRMIAAYHQSAQTLNLIRAFRQGGIDSIPLLHEMNRKNIDRITKDMSTEVRVLYNSHLDVMDKTIRFIESTTRATPSLGRFYTGHECLLLPYEAAMTRLDSTQEGEWYDTSSHFLWLGERTRKRNASHVEFLRGVQNPIGIKVSGSTDVDELVEIVSLLNPERRIGRVTVITRMGADVIPLKLPPIVRALRDHPILWCCDPMHANTFTLNGVKTRSVREIHRELHAFFMVMRRLDAHPGGIHLELTSRDVAECMGGSLDPISSSDITTDRYDSPCDPRLSGAQAIETAFYISDILQSGDSS